VVKIKLSLYLLKSKKFYWPQPISNLRVDPGCTYMVVSGKTIVLRTLHWVLAILHRVLVKENDCIGGREIARAPSCALTQLFLSFKRIQKKSVVVQQQ
jgi:hypothetical protein